MSKAATYFLHCDISKSYWRFASWCMILHLQYDIQMIFLKPFQLLQSMENRSELISFRVSLNHLKCKYLRKMSTNIAVMNVLVHHMNLASFWFYLTNHNLCMIGG